MGSASDGNFTLTNASAQDVEISVPVFPYRTIIKMPFEIVQSKKTYHAYDYGSNYDKRTFEGQLVLSATDANDIATFLGGSGNGRAVDLTLDMVADSGFFPFGPDKGDAGGNTVTAEITKHYGVGPNPYGYFTYDFRMHNTASFPAYTPPAQITEGSLQLGSISGIRFPPLWFEPDASYDYTITQEEDATVRYVNCGSGGDQFVSQFTLVCNESTAAALIGYLVGTARAGAFNLVSASGHYPFGRDKGDGTFSVKLIQNTITITHTQHDRFEIPLRVVYISG